MKRYKLFLLFILLSLSVLPVRELMQIGCAKPTGIPKSEPQKVRPYLGLWRNTNVTQTVGTRLGFLSERVYAIYDNGTYAGGSEFWPNVADLTRPDGISYPDSIKEYVRNRYYAAITWNGTYQERSDHILQFKINYIQSIAGQWNIQPHIQYTLRWKWDGVRLSFYPMQHVAQFAEEPFTYDPILDGQNIPLLRIMKVVR